jgi:hypothetical protein
MNRQLNIKTLSLGIVVVLAMLAFGGLSVQAQTTTAADAPVDSSITLVVKGSVTDPNGTVNVQGQANVAARRVVDTTSVANPSIVLLDFDFSQVTGTSGSTKATLKNYVTGENHATELRPLQASDTVIVPVPYYDSTKDALSARTMLVSVTLNFDVGTGKLTGGSISVGNNVVTANSVGTVSAQPIQ